ncbi:prepilin-type N-terminal cleavage/methylation domain-containing protein [Coraliomargarita sp. SDUM461004]|uniref:Prepilin-type N-terminal cleavage/methylation domain-containing protein n=1 Tax=Thalassobacterium sedimentorum TaxID=3041258 RepID=A0ABU1AL67_9BACT|nr:prepilin-type N-terminal cleavage/methylation domain-containing protein [Coraliomargarita sp. SDUM461004]MDQ8195551.1 prepilin-type N-terminal cleavage/methylation domain-containing protein [Coraliomargarita sp. SDUM461004]
MKTQQTIASPEGRHSHGYTIVEIVIAIMVLGIGLTSATVCLRSGMLLHDNSRATTYATQVLQDEAESLRLMNWSHIGSLSRTKTLTPSDTLGSDEIRPERFTFTRVIDDVTGKTDLKSVLLQAEWEGINKKMHYLSIEFLYAKNGMHDYFYGVRP